MAATTIAIRPATLAASRQPLNRRFVCDWPGCEQSYVRSTILQNHIDAEHKQLKHICVQCDQEFRYKNDLKQHQKRKHGAQRSHVCQVEPRNPSDCACGRHFSSSSDLRRHQRAHIRRQHRGLDEELRNQSQPGPITDVARYHNAKTVRRLTEPICRSPARRGLLEDIERAVYSVQNYVVGSFESGHWYADGIYCRSITQLRHGPAVYLIDLFRGLLTALSMHRLDIANFHLNRVCRRAQSIVLAENPEFLTDLLYYAFAGFVWTPRLKAHLNQSLEVFCTLLAAMSTQFHGTAHPFTAIMQVVAKLLRSANCADSLLRLLQVLRHSYGRVLGDGHALGLLIEVQICRDSNDPILRLRQIFDESQRSLGRWNEVSRQCAGEIIQVLHEKGDLAGIEKKINDLSPCLTEVADVERRGEWQYLISQWRYYLAEGLDNHRQRATIIFEEVIPTLILLIGEDDELVDSWLFRLEDALERTEQWDRLEEVRERQASRLSRLQAEEIALQRMEEMEWEQNGIFTDDETPD